MNKLISSEKSSEESFQTEPPTNSLELPIELDDWEGPTLFYCNTCKMESVSICKYESSYHTYICSFLLFLAFNIAGCCIPFCVNSCKDRKQFCPRCNNLVGKHKFNICACQF